MSLAPRLSEAPSAAGAPAAGLIARSAAMLQVMDMAARAARTDVSIMLLGESGVGKEVLARYVHRESPRAAGPFVAINCAAIPESLLEATLFGFDKGAFTGAAQSAPGKFEQAQGGTLLLDEVTEMAASLQAKLLRVLQEREIERLGGRRRIPLDLRIVATSNRDLQQAVGQGVLREDLFYRLSVFPLRVPALRERPEDIVALAEAMLRRFAQQYAGGQAAAALDGSARQALLAHAWPGNVRELENVMQRAAILCSAGRITAADLLLQPGAAPGAAAPRPAPAPQMVRPAAVETLAGAGAAAALPGQGARALGAELAENERRMIADALRESAGSRKLAAQRLGISPRTLRHKLQRLREAGLELPASFDDADDA
ncbi:MAG: sigma 54-interacting transcriptional regulator [Betaproteobacteria bacterium]|nr:sigma 54-interacting transcriptional regulator [Betaproteobacteria bacterium]MDE2154096.1 sigma 54-interacting transcriptional regulator [Betaproteobacteria bacterium]MDE2477680.1 sigma 54-interacting transcriptional regulator [Betaproteobacteria bacterium]